MRTPSSNLGNMYATGRGGPQDSVQAHMWLNLAASKGDTDAVKVRDKVAEKMTPAQIAEEQDCSHATVLAYLEKYDIPIREYAPEVQRRGQIPYGYRLINGQLFPFIREQKVIHEMVSMRQQGDSLGEITQWLNNSGIKTKNLKAKWDRPTVYKILNRMSKEK